MKKRRKNYSAGYAEYQKAYHKKWLENPVTRDKWNTYQRARTCKNAMVLEISKYFKGKIRTDVVYDEALCAYRVTGLFKGLTSVSKIVFRRAMAEKGYTVDFDDGVSVTKNFEVPSEV
jgi:hypothetical protein